MEKTELQLAIEQRAHQEIVAEELSAPLTLTYFEQPHTVEKGYGQREKQRELSARLYSYERIRENERVKEAKERQTVATKQMEVSVQISKEYQVVRTCDALDIPAQKKSMEAIEQWATDRVAKGKWNGDARTWNDFLLSDWNNSEAMEELKAERNEQHLTITQEGRTRKGTFIDMYVQGFITVKHALSLEYIRKLTFGHHAKRLMGAKDNQQFTSLINELGENGINLNRVMAVLKQCEGRAANKANGNTNTHTHTPTVKAPKVESANEKLKREEYEASHPLTPGSQEWEVREAVRVVDEAHVVKDAVSKVREKGYSVELTAEQKVAILKAHTTKRAMVIK